MKPPSIFSQVSKATSKKRDEEKKNRFEPSHFFPPATNFPLSHTLANSRSSNYNTSERCSQVSCRSWAKIGFDVGVEGREKKKTCGIELPAEHVGLVAPDCGAAASSVDSLLSLFFVSGV